MFRSLFRSNRTLRVPIDDAGHDIRRVKILKRAVSKPSTLISGFFVAYFVVRILEASLFAPDEPDGKNKAGEDDGKANQAKSVSQTQMSDHWKKAHKDLQDKEHARDLKPNTVHIRPSNILQAPGAGSQQDQLGQNMITAITLPVWIRERKCPLYTSLDPEYKDYVQLQGDKQKVANLKKQVVDWSITRLRNPIHTNGLAYIGFEGKIVVVLEMIPQLRPPALYEVPCLIVFRDGIGWGWRVLPPQVGTKMDTLMRPSIAFAAAKASVGAFFSTAYTIAKAKFSDEPSKATGPLPTAIPNPVMSAKEVARDNDMPPISRWTSTTQSIQDLLRAVHNGQSFQERHNSVIKNVPFSRAIEVAAETYKRKQVLGTALDQQKRTRGAIFIKGTIYCMGNRGKYRMDVRACYLPSEDKFLGPLVLNSAYLIKDYSQWDQVEQEQKKKRTASQQERIAKNAKRDISAIDEANSEPSTEKDK